MLFRLLVAFTSVLLVGVQAQSAPYRLLNMGPEFRIYVEHFRNADANRQWNGWLSFERKYKKYFNEVSCDSLKPDCETSKKNRLREFFARLPSFETDMWDIFKNADALARVQVSKFRKMFPNVKNDIPIVFMPSLLSFNGRGGLKINGTFCLVIGADLAALRNNNMNVLFSHELFHTYQFEKLKNIQNYLSLASPLWFEGMAAWVSLQLNPDSTETDILMNEELAEFCHVKSNIRAMAQKFEPILKLKYVIAQTASIDSEWFAGDARTQPARRGYCLGLHAVSEIIKSKPIDELVSLNEIEFSVIVSKALTRLSLL